MDALDLLVDFATLLSYSTSATNSGTISSAHENTTSPPRISTLLREDLPATPVIMQHPSSAITREDWMGRPQNSPSAAVRQGALLAHLVQSHERTVEGQGLLVDYQPHWSDCTSLEQYSSQHLQKWPGGVRESQDRYAASWTSLRTSGCTVCIKIEPWGPHQYRHGFYIADEARRLATSGAELYEAPCMDDRCSCQTFASKIFPACRQNSVNEVRDAEVTFRGGQNGMMLDPWTAIAMGEEQRRLSQTHRY